MKRKVIILLTTITILLLFGIVSARAATSGNCGNNVTYTLDDDGTLTISGTGEMMDYSYWDPSPFYEDTSVKTVIIEDNITKIGTHTFESCNELTSVTIPKSVRNIDVSAFYRCDKLTSVYVADLTSYLSINFEDTTSNPMYYASKLYVNNKRIAGNVVIPNTITKIPVYAFRHCDGISSVTIPQSVKKIDFNAFEGCTGLASVYVQDLEDYLNISYDDYYSNPMYYAKKLYINNKYIEGDVIIPNTVTKIPYNAFRNCDEIESVTIPESVSRIEQGAFANCSMKKLKFNAIECNVAYDSFSGDIEAVKIGNKVKIIPANIFRQTNDIKSIIIPPSVMAINEKAFYGCRWLETIYIPKTTTEIEQSAFERCNILNNVEYGGSEEDWAKIYIGAGNEPLTSAQINYNAESIPLTTINVTKTETDSQWNFDVAVGKTYSFSYVYATVYNEEGNIVGINRVPLETEGNTVITVDKSTEDKYAKIFVWTDDMQPIAEAENVDL